MSDFQPRHTPDNLNALCDELTEALAAGRIDEARWYDLRRQATAAAYLPRENPRAQSGSGGDERRWHYTRVMMILEAIDRDGAFLDVGCTNGYLLECLERWVGGSGLDVTFHGVDISPELIDLARRRAAFPPDRFHVANAVTWTPPRVFDFVHVHELSYAPPHREHAFLEHLLGNYLAPRGRLILGPWAVDRDSAGLEQRLAEWDCEPSGWLLKSDRRDPTLTRKMLWFDRP